ncbi:MAG: Rieske (2Fe-2S) protein [Deltaproteobacteria bacterium]|nr:Rieske (2Fe-2S) protein [Deltaproteobacteria bacterium]
MDREPFGADLVGRVPELNVQPDGWACAGAVAQCAEGRAMAVAMPNFRIAIFHRPEGWFAVKDACPHAAYPLSKSPVVNDVVTCANHNWRFRLSTGECLRGDPDISIRTFDVTIRNEQIWIKVA